MTQVRTLPAAQSTKCRAEDPAKCSRHAAYRQLEIAQSLGNPTAIRLAQTAIAESEARKTARATYTEACQEDTPPERFKELVTTGRRDSTSTGKKILCAVAANPSAPQDILYELLDSKAPEVKCAAAQNPALPAYAQMHAYRQSPKVRASLAQNLATDPRILSLLSKTEDTQTLSAVAQNRSTAREDLQTLALHPDKRIASAAVTTLLMR